MKKTVMIALFALMTAAAVFAQYTVEEVSGRVERDAGKGKWEAVKTGDSLKADTIIKTAVGANLKVKFNGKVLTVGPMKTGKIEDLAGSSSTIQIQGKVVQTDTSTVNRNSGNASTASARASDAAAEIEVAEE